jgi:hypothetical protein
MNQTSSESILPEVITKPSRATVTVRVQRAYDVVAKLPSKFQPLPPLLRVHPDELVPSFGSIFELQSSDPSFLVGWIADEAPENTTTGPADRNPGDADGANTVRLFTSVPIENLYWSIKKIKALIA